MTATSPLSEPPPEPPELITISAHDDDRREQDRAAGERPDPLAPLPLGLVPLSRLARLAERPSSHSDRELIGPRTYRLAITGSCMCCEKADSAARDCGPPPAPTTA